MFDTSDLTMVLEINCFTHMDALEGLYTMVCLWGEHLAGNKRAYTFFWREVPCLSTSWYEWLTDWCNKDYNDMYKPFDFRPPRVSGISTTDWHRECKATLTAAEQKKRMQEVGIFAGICMHMQAAGGEAIKCMMTDRESVGKKGWGRGSKWSQAHMGSSTYLTDHVPRKGKWGKDPVNTIPREVVSTGVERPKRLREQEGGRGGPRGRGRGRG